ncbi:MAG: pentapeptide repeat-containing protein [Planctomycetota bacterium]
MMPRNSVLDLSRHGLGDAELFRLIKEGRLDNVEHLYLWGNSITDDGLEALAAHRGLSTLKSLYIWGNAIEDRGLVALGTTRYLTLLERLDLTWNHVGDKGVAALAQGPYAKRLKSLNLSFNRVTDAAAPSLAGFLALRVLDLQDTLLTQAGYDSLRRKMPSGTEIRWDGNESNRSVPPAARVQPQAPGLQREPNRLGIFDLSKQSLTDEGLRVALESTDGHWIRELHLWDNEIGAPGAAFLAARRDLSEVDELHMWGNRIGDQGLRSILGAPWMSALRLLDVGRNQLTKDALDDLSSVDRPLRLLRLDLSENDLGAGVSALVRSGVVGRVNLLDLNRTGVGSDELRTMCDGRQLPYLQDLKLSRNRLAAADLVRLAQSPLGQTLRSLRLDHNRLGSDALLEIARQLDFPSLHDLDVASCELGESDVVALARDANLPQLRRLVLAGNSVGAGAEALSSNLDRFPELRTVVLDEPYDQLSQVLNGRGLADSLSEPTFSWALERTGDPHGARERHWDAAKVAADTVHFYETLDRGFWLDSQLRRGGDWSMEQHGARSVWSGCQWALLSHFRPEASGRRRGATSGGERAPVPPEHSKVEEQVIAVVDSSPFDELLHFLFSPSPFSAPVALDASDWLVAREVSASASVSLAGCSATVSLAVWLPESPPPASATEDMLAGLLTQTTQSRYWVFLVPRTSIPDDQLGDLHRTAEERESISLCWDERRMVDVLLSAFPGLGASLGKDLPEVDSATASDIKHAWLERLRPYHALSNGDRLSLPWVRYLVEVTKRDSTTKGDATISDMRRRCRGGMPGSTVRAEFEDWLVDRGRSVLFLLGEFGTGKTLHSRTLTAHASRRRLETESSVRVPLRLVLKRYSTNGGSFERILDAAMEGRDPLPDVDLILVLDGLDEVVPYVDRESRRAALEALLAFMEDYRGAKFLITCRTQYFLNLQEEDTFVSDVGDRLETGVRKLELLPFGAFEVASCVARLLPGRFRNDQEALASLASTHDLLGLSANPLIMSMVAGILDEFGDGRAEQAAVYDKYAWKWFDREFEKYFSVLRRTKERVFRGVQEVMEELAYHLFLVGEDFVPFDQLVASLSKLDVALVEALKRATPFLGEDVPEAIKTRSFLVREGDRFGFVHRSVQEYFFARKLCAAIEAEDCSVLEDGLSGGVLPHEVSHFVAGLTEDADSLGALCHSLAMSVWQPGSYVPANLLGLHYVVEPACRDGASGRDWSGIVARSALLMGARLDGALFRGANLEHAHMENASLRGGDLRGARLSGVCWGSRGRPTHLRWGDDPGRLHCLYDDGQIYEWDIRRKSPRELARLEELARLPTEGVFRPLDFLCVGSASIVVCQGGVLSGPESFLTWLTSATTPEEVSVDGEADTLAVLKGAHLEVVSLRRSNIVLSEEVSEHTRGLTCSKAAVVTLNRGSIVRVYLLADSDFGKRTHEVLVKNVACATTDRHARGLFAGCESGMIRAYSLSEDESGPVPIWSTDEPCSVRRLAVDDASISLALLLEDGSIRIRGAQTGELTAELRLRLQCSEMKIDGARGLTKAQVRLLREAGATGAPAGMEEGSSEDLWL